MPAVFRRRRRWSALLIAALAVFIVAGPAPARADAVRVAIDQARVLRLPDQVITIVIGNPLIADATLQRGGLLVVTGKSYGETNLLGLDVNGQIVLDRAVTVLGPATADLVTVYKGVERQSYSCTPDCEPRLTLGDAPNYFDGMLGQIGARNGQAEGNGAPANGTQSGKRE